MRINVEIFCHKMKLYYSIRLSASNQQPVTKPNFNNLFTNTIKREWQLVQCFSLTFFCFTFHSFKWWHGKNLKDYMFSTLCWCIPCSTNKFSHYFLYINTKHITIIFNIWHIGKSLCLLFVCYKYLWKKFFCFEWHLWQIWQYSRIK